MSEYPECEKLAEVSKESQKIGEFLEWLGEQSINLCEFDSRRERYFLIVRSKESILAEYFDIDMNKVEVERRLMFERLRGAEA